MRFESFQRGVRIWTIFIDFLFFFGGSICIFLILPGGEVQGSNLLGHVLNGSASLLLSLAGNARLVILVEKVVCNHQNMRVLCCW